MCGYEGSITWQEGAALTVIDKEEQMELDEMRSSTLSGMALVTNELIAM